MRFSNTRVDEVPAAIAAAVQGVAQTEVLKPANFSKVFEINGVGLNWVVGAKRRRLRQTRHRGLGIRAAD